MATASVGQVIEALSALYSTPDPQAKKQANKWLANFQKQVQTHFFLVFLIKQICYINTLLIKHLVNIYIYVICIKSQKHGQQQIIYLKLTIQIRKHVYLQHKHFDKRFKRMILDLDIIYIYIYISKN